MVFDSQRGHDPQVENYCSSVLAINCYRDLVVKQLGK